MIYGTQMYTGTHVNLPVDSNLWAASTQKLSEIDWCQEKCCDVIPFLIMEVSQVFWKIA